MNLETQLSVPPQVMSRLVGDETVLLDLSSGEYFGLDHVGQRIWEAIAEKASLADILKLVTAEFDIGSEQAETDLREFADMLLERGLLVVKNTE